MANPLLVKAAIMAATDKRTWKAVGAVIAGIVTVILVPLLLIITLLSGGADYNKEIADAVFNDTTLPYEIMVEYAEHVERMKELFRELDMEMDLLEEEMHESLDRIRVKCFFYALYFGKDALNFPDDFIRDFVLCFVTAGENPDEEAGAILEPIEDMEEIYANVSDLTGRVLTETDRQNINNLYLYIKYGYSASSSFGGFGGMSGIPGEAFNDATFAKLMGEAAKHIGRPYVWGGSNPSTSFDCSGFVCWSYTQSGVYYLPRDTAQGIYNKCAPVAQDEVKPGDLVFFHSTYATDKTVTHIGIYVGDNKMIHAGDPIGYADLTTSYWKSHFLGYGRLNLAGSGDALNDNSDT